MSNEVAQMDAVGRLTVAIKRIEEKDAEIEQLRAESDISDALLAAEKAKTERLKALLREARRFVSDAGNDEDGETKALSGELLGEIDAALARKEG
jgi:hypothetical protein